MASTVPPHELEHLKPNVGAAREQWQRVNAELKFKFGEAVYNSWIKPLNIEAADEGQITLSAPTRFIKEWILSHYLDDIRGTWHDIDASIIHIDIRVKAQQFSSQGTQATITEHHAAAVAPEKITPLPTQNKAKQSAQTTSNNNQQPDATSPLSLLESINSRPKVGNTFEQFVVGQSNELAYSAALSVAESSSVLEGANPLFLYGGVGLGKTHLMHAIAHHILQHTPERKVIYLSAEKFMYQFIRSLRNKDIVSFKEFFRSVDVLMVDDIQFICGKNSTQEEFFHTFNSLIDDNKQLILSGDRSPSDLDGMEERVKSRLGWGLVADINASTYELRLGILQSKLHNGTHGIHVPDDVVEFLARRISSNIRELEGALTKLITHAKITHREITLDSTRFILQDLLKSAERVITIDDIKQTVAEHCNIRMSDMHSSRRARNIARPRQMAMYLSKKLTPHSLPEIGRRFGGKDHTTVIHAVKKVEELYQLDKEVRDDIDILTNLLER